VIFFVVAGTALLAVTLPTGGGFTPSAAALSGNTIAPPRRRSDTILRNPGLILWTTLIDVFDIEGPESERRTSVATPMLYHIVKLLSIYRFRWSV
jgi:hypothetical protein